MEKKILLSNNNTYLRYTVTANPRAKKLLLRVSSLGVVTLTVPSRTSESFYESFVAKNTLWIQSQLDKLNLDGKTPTIHRKKYLEAKASVIRLAKERLAYFNAHYQFKYEKITVRDQSSRWGSCSNTGTLSFNYRIIYLEEALQDYIFVHELCHLKEMNHSQRFWDLVGETVPTYKYLRRRLKRYESSLF